MFCKKKSFWQRFTCKIIEGGEADIEIQNIEDNLDVVMKQDEGFIKSENKENVEERTEGDEDKTSKNYHPCPKSNCERIFKFQSGLRNHLRKSHKDFSTEIMVIRVVEFSNGEYKIRKIFV